MLKDFRLNDTNCMDILRFGVKEKFLSWDSKIETIFNFILPIYFLASGFVNILAYYFGLHNIDIARKVFTFSLLAVFLIIALLRLLFLFFKKNSKKMILKVSLIPMIYFLILVICLIRYNFNNQIFTYLLSFIIYVVPLYVVALDLVLNEKVEKLIKNFLPISIMLTPCAIFYILRLILARDKWSALNLGSLSYMALAYTFLPIVFAIVFNLIEINDRTNMKSFLLHILLILSVAVICLSGTRGAIVGLYSFAFALLIYQFISKTLNRDFIKVFVLLLLLTTTLINFSPRKDSMFNFLDAISNGDLTKAAVVFEKKPLSSEQTPIPAEQTPIPTEQTPIPAEQTPIPAEQTPIPAEQIPVPAEQTPIPAEQTPIPTEQTPVPAEHTPIKSEQTIPTEKPLGTELARMGFYSSAIHEFLQNPITGMGALGYTVKYGDYPHNFLLEILCEYGIVIFLIFILVLGALFLKLVFLTFSNKNIVFILIFICGFLPQMMLSGTVYTNEIICFALVYSAAQGEYIFRFRIKENKLTPF